MTRIEHLEWAKQRALAYLEPLGYSRDGEFVTLRMTDEDHQQLLICIGVAWAGEMAGSSAG